MILNTLINQKIGTLIIGHNPGWKQKVNLGKRNNQNFVSIPYNKLIEMLSYKAEMVGIKVIITEESYTSKASFLDNDPLPVYQKGQKNQVIFSGKRVNKNWRQIVIITITASISGFVGWVLRGGTIKP